MNPFYASFQSSYFHFLNNFSSFHNFLFLLDFETSLFLFMVFLVTMLVVVYSEVYMEHYNMKKFFWLTFLFLGSMAVLSSSGNFLNLMIGWDGLGVSSLCLIMFYPNKTSLFNSFMTFFFNRLGDLILMVIFVCSIFSPNLFFFFNNLEVMIFCSLMMICSFTKSAQFPFSSWLPAAMSAPTPISAMVHSSTLVTAGIFILWKISFILQFSNIYIFPFFVSLITFLVGGFLANAELDLKKIVAFSTMSQISMVVFFISLALLALSGTHMFFHALFKTLLFCGCGILFMFNFSGQHSKLISWMKNNKSLQISIFVSIFSMSGLIFSSSFFSKDLVLEKLLSESEFFSFFCLIVGSMATIFYSVSLLSSLIFSFKKNNIPFSNSKNYYFPFFILFLIFTFFCPFFLKFFLILDVNPVISTAQILLILSLVLLPFFFNLENLKKHNSYLSLDIIFSKFFSFSMASKFLHLDKYSTYFNDQLFFKPNMNFFFSINPILVSKLSTLFIIFFLFTSFIFFFSLI